MLNLLSRLDLASRRSWQERHIRHPRLTSSSRHIHQHAIITGEKGVGWVFRFLETCHIVSLFFPEIARSPVLLALHGRHILHGWDLVGTVNRGWRVRSAFRTRLIWLAPGCREKGEGDESNVR